MGDNLTKSLTYRESGVDVEAGNVLASWIGKRAKTTHRPEVLGGIGSFAGLCGLPPGLEDPVLVSGTDGVGTKLMIAKATGIHDTVGIDLVAMCVNDVITVGAAPLFFLDYLATGKLEQQTAKDVIDGIIEGCQQAGCALIGGETAEMPGMYGEGDYDLAGFVVGVIERAKLIDGSRIAAGDMVIGLPSSGVHSNGFSLVRRVFEGVSYDEVIGPLQLPLGRELLTPTRIYARSVAALLAADVDVRGLVHITGGGLIDNPPRCLPADGDLGFIFDPDTWDVPAVMQVIQKRGNIADDEMRLTFNMGLGLLVVVAPDKREAALAVAAEHGGRVVGRIAKNVAPVSFE